MKIGIPRSLLWYKYHIFWEAFFKELGCSTVVTDPTNKNIVERGARISIDELCIPIKIFYGHCYELLGQCDKLFVPRYWRIEEGSVTCPKFITLTDTVQALFNGQSKHRILSLTVNTAKKPLLYSFYHLGLKINKNPFRVARAIQSALHAQREDIYSHQKTFYKKLSGKRPKIALIGHEYNIYDRFINQDLHALIEEQGFDMIPCNIVPTSLYEKYLEEKPFIHWSYEKEIIGAAYWALASKDISALIYISSFNCGPDSLLFEQLLLEETPKPSLSILFDENTSHETIKTRVEAFGELLMRKKLKNHG